MLNSEVYWTTCEIDVTCDLLCWITTILACMLVGLKSLVISLDYRSYMGSSVKIGSLRWLFLYLCSYNLDGSVIAVTLGHLWYNLGTVAVPISATPLGILPVCQEVQARPTLGLTPLAPHTSLLPPVCALSLNGSKPELSYSALRSERLMWPTKC
jgi:hypothetical protein